MCLTPRTNEPKARPPNAAGAPGRPFSRAQLRQTNPRAAPWLGFEVAPNEPGGRVRNRSEPGRATSERTREAWRPSSGHRPGERTRATHAIAARPEWAVMA
jgi:hypothetical protein